MKQVLDDDPMRVVNFLFDSSLELALDSSPPLTHSPNMAYDSCLSFFYFFCLFFLNFFSTFMSWWWGPSLRKTIYPHWIDFLQAFVHPLYFLVEVGVHWLFFIIWEASCILFFLITWATFDGHLLQLLKLFACKCAMHWWRGWRLCFDVIA